VTVVAASALFCLEFRLSHSPEDFKFGNLFALMVAIHSLIGVGEALITGAVVGYVLAQRPDLILTNAAEPRRGLISGVGRVTAAGTVLALCVGAFLAPFASQLPDGLDAVAEKHGFSELGRSAWSLFGDYNNLLPTGNWQSLSVSLAGVLGTLSVFLLAMGFGRAVSLGSRAVEAGRE
jgi:cobalt/nickel transport system permease protein